MARKKKFWEYVAYCLFFLAAVDVIAGVEFLARFDDEFIGLFLLGEALVQVALGLVALLVHRRRSRAPASEGAPGQAERF